MLLLTPWGSLCGPPPPPAEHLGPWGAQSQTTGPDNLLNVLSKERSLREIKVSDRIAHVVWSQSSPPCLADLYVLCLCKHPKKEPEEWTIPARTDTSRKDRKIRERTLRGLSNLSCLHFFSFAVFMHLDVICIIKNKLKKKEF